MNNHLIVKLRNRTNLPLIHAPKLQSSRLRNGRLPNWQLSTG